MRWFCVILWVHILSLPLFSQEIIVSGTIYSKDDAKLLPNVNILVRSKASNKVVAFGVSKESGDFQVKIPEDKITDTTISFSYIGFETVTKDLSGTDQTFTVTLKPEAINIKEVSVKAPKIRAQGDTLVYNVASYARDYDKTIGDVLKKLPGIEVQESGQITFNGTPINKFYVEGSDLLGGKYGIATNSISSKDVSTVEVLQDHQPVRALEGLSFSDRAAINLRLKEDAKHKWIGTLQGGAGFTPFLWDAGVNALRFTKKIQSINTYKTNNTGTDVTREFESFDLREMQNKTHRLPDYITADPPFSLGLDRKRELFNRTHQVTANTLTKLGNDFELKANSSYIGHRETANSSVQTDYYEVQGDTVRIREDEDSRFYRKKLSAGLVLEANKSGYNLTNKLNGDFSWIDRKVSVAGTFPNNQKAYSPYRQLSNDLYLLKRFGKDFVSVQSYMVYQSHPQNFTVSRSQSEQTQAVSQSGFFTNNTVGYGMLLGKVVTSFTAGVSAMYKTLQTELDGVDVETGLSAGSSRFGYTRCQFIPKIEYDFRKIKMMLSFPLNFYTYDYKDKMSDEKSSHDVLLLTPELFIEMDVTPRFKLSLSGEAGKSEVNDKQFYPAVILSDYRSLSEGLPLFIHGTRKSLTGGLSYKRPLDELFSSIHITRSWDETPYTLNQVFSNEYIFSSYSQDKNKSRTWLALGFFNKGIDFLKGYFFLNASYLKSDALLIRNGVETPNTRTGFTVTPKIETSPTRWLVCNYGLNYSYNTLSLGSGQEKIKRNNINQFVLFRLLPLPEVNIDVRGEHYYNELSETERKHFLLADLAVKYRITKSLELSMSITNIFNRKQYSYVSLTDEVSTVYYDYKIRPRNFMLSGYYVF